MSSHDALQQLCLDALESARLTPDQLRDEIETSIERFAHRLADDDTIVYAWHIPSAGDPPAKGESLEVALRRPHDPEARLIGIDKRAGFTFDVEQYGLGETHTIRLRIRAANLSELEIPIDAVDEPKAVFLVRIARGIYRLGGRAVSPARPLRPADARREARAS